jgi:hypothetical protein
MRLGDIVQAKSRHWTTGKHYIICLRGNGIDLLIGAVLTTRSQDNIPLRREHFKSSDEYGRKFKVQFRSSHIVKGRFIKPPKWGPYKKVGELTPEGIDFVVSIVQHEPETYWDDFLTRNSYLKAS